MKFVTGLVASLFLAAPAFAAPFTAAELATAAKSATEAFKAELGAELYGSVYAFQASRAPDGGKVKVFYKQAAQTKTVEYFCHYHEADEIDCHEL